LRKEQSLPVKAEGTDEEIFTRENLLVSITADSEGLNALVTNSGLCGSIREQ
jgi:hypothetical protein